MSNRELVVLGTASQAPTRRRNHNGYFLRWDGEGLLFDPGEGTQRQMLFAGVTASQVTRVCVTHFHGDHCLGLPGVLQRMSLDRVPHPVHAHYPAASQEVFDRLRHASLFHDAVALRPAPVHGDGVIAGAAGFRLEARALSHLVPTVGYRLTEPDGRRMLPERLVAAGIAGPDIGRLQREGRLEAGGRLVALEEVSEHRRGQRFAFVMDTRLCDAAFELAQEADMLVCESTFADADAGLARDYGHLTAGQAGRIAAESGARLLVLTHFSQRYELWPPERLRDDAARAFGGEIVLAADLDRINIPRRPAPSRPADHGCDLGAAATAPNSHPRDRSTRVRRRPHGPNRITATSGAERRSPGARSAATPRERSGAPPRPRALPPSGGTVRGRAKRRNVPDRRWRGRSATRTCAVPQPAWTGVPAWRAWAGR